MLKSLFTLNVVTMHRHFHRRLSEWHLGLAMFLSGMALEMGDTFALAPFAVVRQIASQEFWALAMLLIGGGRVVVLVVNGAMGRGSPHLRAIFASLSAILWSVLLAALITFETPLIIVPFLLMAVLVDLINAFRAAQDARQEDDQSEGTDGIPG